MKCVWVALACNDHRNGAFVGKASAVNYDGLDLVHENIDGGTRVKFVADGIVKIGRATYRYEKYRPWFGNWCWDGFAMRRHEAHRLLFNLRRAKRWMCEGGPARLCDWWDSHAV